MTGREGRLAPVRLAQGKQRGQATLPDLSSHPSLADDGENPLCGRRLTGRFEELRETFYDARLLPFSDLREERKPEKARAQVFSEREIALLITKLLSHHRRVQRNVMKDRDDPVPLQMRHQVV